MICMRMLTFLGTGTSVGVPMIGCSCPVCTSPDPRNQRFRCSVLIHTDYGNILIDTTPELRLQLLRAKVSIVHAVLFTHAHADHMYGLDDLRPIPKLLGGPVPLFCTTEVERKLRQAFAYAFSAEAETLPSGYLPKLVFRNIASEPFTVLDERITPIPLEHAHFNVLGFRIGDLAYCTDVNKISRESMSRLEGLDILILDALRFKPHPAHFCVDEALDVIAQLRPAKAYLTHMSHDIDHETLSRTLPPNVGLAYDGLCFPF
ncbi:MAG: MBL fold metallo-hydrolase [Planctomycetes bacterium]|nr:MBL fold metallo-hydrolase [Planctomycetota bacterium]